MERINRRWEMPSSEAEPSALQYGNWAGGISTVLARVPRGTVDLPDLSCSVSAAYLVSVSTTARSGGVP